MGLQRGRHAFVDESYRKGDPFMVCAVIIAPADLSAMRSELRALRMPGASRIHMSGEGDQQRRRVWTAVKDMDVEARLYLASKNQPIRRARDECLRRLVPDLCELQVTNLYIESCDQDRQDAVVIRSARTAAGNTELYFDHRNPTMEPMLWLPDIVAWAWGRSPLWRKRVNPLVSATIDIAA